MFRLCSFLLLLISLGGIAFSTLDYVDPPATDPLEVSFFASGKYLPAGESVKRKDLGPAVRKLLAEDRRNYKRILYLSGIACLCGFALFFASTSNHAKDIEPTAPANRR